MGQSLGVSLEKIADVVETANGAFDVTLADASVTALVGTGPKTLTDLDTSIKTTLAASICGSGAAAKTLADVETAVKTTLAAAVCGAGAAAKTLADVVMGLSDNAGAGLPVKGTDATGQDAYGTIVTAPARVCRNLFISVATKSAIISLDGGTTEHFLLPVGNWTFTGLAIASGAEIQAKNADAGQNYTDLTISVW